MNKLIKNENTFFWIILFVIGPAWGLSFSLSKIVTSTNAHPLGIIYWQVYISSIILLFLLLIKNVKFKINFLNIYFFSFISLLGVVVPGIIFYISASKVPAGILSISVSFVPMLTYVFSLILKIEKLSYLKLIGVVFGFISILILVGPQNSFTDRSIIPWILLAMICPFCYTFENLYLDLKKPKEMDSISLSLGASLISIIILTPIVFYFDCFMNINFPFRKVEWSLIGLSTISAISYTLFIYLISKAGAVFASLTGYIVTISGVLWGIILFKESHSLWVWISLCVMIFGLSLVRPSSRNN